MQTKKGNYSVWLRGNRRADAVMLAGAICIIAAGAYASTFGGAVTTLGYALMGVGIGGSIRQFFELLRPRLATDGKHLLVYCGGWRPVRVPLEIVEVFFLGQGPSKLPQPVGKPLENSTVVVRLAESATEWHKRRTNKRLAHWCEGYITLRGVWCEPLTTECLRRLNNALVQSKRQLNASGESK